MNKDTLTVRQRGKILWGKPFCVFIITKAIKNKSKQNQKNKSKKQLHHGVRIGFSAARPWVAIFLLDTMMTPPRSESGCGLIWILVTGSKARIHGLPTDWSPGGLGSNPCSDIYQLPFISHGASWQPLCVISSCKDNAASSDHFEDPVK